jgi:hypothetical protein
MLKSNVLLFIGCLFSVIGNSQVVIPAVIVPEQLSGVDSQQHVSDLTYSIRQSNRLTLAWKLSSSRVPEYFAVERSANGRAFEVVAVISRVTKQLQYEWTDDSPVGGRSYYRLRYGFTDSGEYFSRTAACMVAADLSFKFYPNPVDQILIVRSEMPVDVQISDPSGKVRLSASKVQGLQTINVSQLEKGIYIIRFTNKITNVITQQQLIKS